MILVTGGLGYIGSHTTVELLEQGKQVLIIDNLSNSSLNTLEGIEKITGQKIDFLDLDVKESKKLKGLFDNYPQINGIIHFAASKSVEQSIHDPIGYYKNNIGGMLNILDNLSPGIDFIFSSSCTVYGNPKQLPINENAPLNRPQSPYGNSKKIGEEILEDFTLSKRKFKSLSLRYFNPIGAHSSNLIGENTKGIPQNLVPYITKSALGKIPPLTVFGNDYPTPDGTCIRDYIHVVDLARAHVAALNYLNNAPNNSMYEIFNVGTGKGHSVMEVIASFEKVTGKSFDFKVGPRRAGDIISAYADVEKVRKSLGWSSKFGLEEAIQSAWDWEQKNPL